MPYEITEKNLSTAFLMIDKFLHSKEGIKVVKQLSEGENSQQMQTLFGTHFLIAIQNNIRAIEKAQSGWLKKSGKIVKYENELKLFQSHKAILTQLKDQYISHLFILFYKNNHQKELDNIIYRVYSTSKERELKELLEDKLNELEIFESFSSYTAKMDDYMPKPPSQDELLNEAIHTYQNTKEFTLTTVRNLIMQIDSTIGMTREKEPVNLKVFHDFLHKLRTEITAVMNHLEKPKDTESNDVISNFLSNEEFAALGDKKIFKYARSLYCKFIPFSQVVTDVLFGQASGFCSGYVINWAYHIYHGLYQILPRIEIKALFFQKYQENFYTKVKDLYQESDYPVVFMMDELTDLISSKYIFEIEVKIQNGTHSIGLRKIPGTDAFEVFDPNTGIFVFSNSHDFKKWFAYLLNDYQGVKRVTLNKIIPQPSHAQSTIPLSDLKPDCEFLTHSIITMKNQYIKDYKVKSQLKNITDIDQQLKSMEKNHLLYSAHILEAEFNGISLEPINAIMASLCNMDSDQYIAESKRIKKHICKHIDLEIERLAAAFFGKDKAKLKQLALYDLKDRIQSASSTISLEAIIHRWLFDKTLNTTKTNQEILAPQRACHIDDMSKSMSFISKLLKTYDICPYRLNLLREALLHKLRYAFDETAIDKHLNMKTLLEPVQRIIKDGLDRKEPPRSILINILDQKNLPINQLLQNLNVDSPTSLKEIYYIFSNKPYDGISQNRYAVHLRPRM